MGCCNKRTYLIEKLNETMKDFYYRLIRHDFVINKILEFNKSIKNYHDFFVLTKFLGIHSDLSLQINYWETAYVTHSETSLDGLIFIFLFLCDGEINNKLEYIKYYLSVIVNLSNENDKNLIMNCNDFKRIIYVYFSCLTTIPLNSYIKIKKLKDENSENLMREHFDDKVIKSFIDFITKDYIKKNFYINAGKFLDENIKFLVNDNLIRYTIFNFKKSFGRSSGIQLDEINSKEEIILNSGNLNSEYNPLNIIKENKKTNFLFLCCKKEKKKSKKLGKKNNGKKI